MRPGPRGAAAAGASAATQRGGPPAKHWQATAASGDVDSAARQVAELAAAVPDDLRAGFVAATGDEISNLAATFRRRTRGRAPSSLANVSPTGGQGAPRVRAFVRSFWDLDR